MLSRQRNFVWLTESACTQNLRSGILRPVSVVLNEKISNLFFDIDDVVFSLVNLAVLLTELDY